MFASLIRLLASSLAFVPLASIPLALCTHAQVPAQRAPASQPSPADAKLFADIKAKAEAGNPVAQLDLAEAYDWGVGTTKDRTKAVYWYEKLADEGIIRAKSRLGRIYFNGLGVEKNLPRAIALFEDSVAAGDVPAMVNLGIACFHGVGIAQDKSRAESLFQMAADRGDPHAQFMLANTLAEKKPVDAKRYVELMTASARQRDPGAMTAMGILHRSGDHVVRSLPMAISYLRPPATEGFPEAQFHLAMALLETRDPANYQIHIDWLRKAAAANHLAARFQLAHALQSQPQPEAVAEAVAIYTELHSAGDTKATNNLGLLYIDGAAGLARDTARGIKLLEGIAAEGDVDAMTNLAVMYNVGNGVRQDYAKAAHWYQRAAALGDPKAKTNLGLLYVAGNGVPKNRQKAMSLFLDAATQDYPPALINAGTSMYVGDGVPKDVVKGRKYIERSAELGRVEAMAWLGRVLLDPALKSRQDPKIVNFIRQGAALGDPECTHLLGVYEECISKVEDNAAAAIPYYQKAAQLGWSSSHQRLGVIYRFGMGVPADGKKAVEHFEQAAKLGVLESEYALGVIFAEGEAGVPQDLTRAVSHYQKAAERGYPPAMTNLGYMIEYKKGTSEPESAAVAWFLKAAELGESQSMYNYARALERGFGCSPDPVAAYAWYWVAEDQKQQGAMARRIKLAKTMNDDQLVSARRLAESIRDKLRITRR